MTGVNWKIAKVKFLRDYPELGYKKGDIAAVYHPSSEAKLISVLSKQNSDAYSGSDEDIQKFYSCGWGESPHGESWGGGAIDILDLLNPVEIIKSL